MSISRVCGDLENPDKTLLDSCLRRNDCLSIRKLPDLWIGYFVPQLNLIPDWHLEAAIETKIKWFQTINLSKRMDILCACTDPAFGLSPQLPDKKYVVTLNDLISKNALPAETVILRMSACWSSGAIKKVANHQRFGRANGGL